MYGHTPSSIGAGSIASDLPIRGRNFSAWHEVCSDLVGSDGGSETLNVQAEAGASAASPAGSIGVAA